MIKYDKLKDLYIKVFQEYLKNPDPEIIAMVLGLEKYEVIGLLNQSSIHPGKIIDYLPMIELEDDKIMLVSDTHIGSYNERISYIDRAYDYAIDNDIKSVIHGGDLIHSTKKCVKNNCAKPYEQAMFMHDYYPYHHDIRSYVLFGNHDYHAFRKDPNAIKVIESRQDISILGFKRAYFKFAGELFSVMHKCDKYPIDLPNVDTFLNFYGHRHECMTFGGNSVYIPSLSEDSKDYGEGFEPGFLTMEKHEDSIYVINHPIGKKAELVLIKRY